jgi:hypothetical protein
MQLKVLPCAPLPFTNDHTKNGLVLMNPLWTKLLARSLGDRHRLAQPRLLFDFFNRVAAECAQLLNAMYRKILVASITPSPTKLSPRLRTGGNLKAPFVCSRRRRLRGNFDQLNLADSEEM